MKPFSNLNVNKVSLDCEGKVMIDGDFWIIN
jgi:hypothetical protein